MQIESGWGGGLKGTSLDPHKMISLRKNIDIVSRGTGKQIIKFGGRDSTNKKFLSLRQQQRNSHSPPPSSPVATPIFPIHEASAFQYFD